VTEELLYLMVAKKQREHERENACTKVNCATTYREGVPSLLTSSGNILRDTPRAVLY
jgi:hypothetical protein